MPRRQLPSLTGLCPWFRARPCIHVTLEFTSIIGCTRLMSDTAPVPELETKGGARTRAQPTKKGQLTAGHSRRLTSGGEAVTQEASRSASPSAVA